MNDFYTACRVCLEENENLDEMVSIFDHDNDSNSCIYEKLQACGGIKIVNDPELPTRICSKCQSYLSFVYKFRVICKNSDTFLREFVINPNHDFEELEGGSPEYLSEIHSDSSPDTINDSLKVYKSKEQEEISEKKDDNSINEMNYSEVWPESIEIDEIVEEDEEIEVPDEEEFLDEDLNSYSISAVNSKTLGISSDGTAVISMKSRRNKEKQLHICDICGNSYPRKYSLVAHMRRHRNERPFECEICHQKFLLNFQLTRHIQKHTGARPFTCQYCQRSFADRSTMIKHERIHRNERPYSCQTCGKTFTYSSVLKVHMLTHTGEKPYHCELCGKRFARSHHLRAHLDTQMHQNDVRSKALLHQLRGEEYDTDDKIE